MVIIINAIAKGKVEIIKGVSVIITYCLLDVVIIVMESNLWLVVNFIINFNFIKIYSMIIVKNLINEFIAMFTEVRIL